MRKKIINALILFVSVLFLCTLDAHAAEEDEIEWLPSDFTYTEYSKTLYGCDYTREFIISGPAISGFSEEGAIKLESTTELIIPAVDTNGNKIVAIADNAFSKCGLTKVTFPEGMIVDYDDTVTNTVTKRGNFIIGASAFSGNELTEVYLPEGVIAVLPNAFQNNKLTEVTLPHTIWWIETLSFAGNELTTVEFPKSCDFQLEIHGMAFALNNIKWVRLPDYVEVVYKHAFYFNPGMEECPDDAPEAEKEKGGVVYMYTDNANLMSKNRIHHIEKTASTQQSWHQRLITESAPEGYWTVDDFTYEGTAITGFSESGLSKRTSQADLVLPDKNPSGEWITEIASAKAASCGLFASDEVKYNSVTLPSKLEKIGDYAFQDNGIQYIREFPGTLKEIGNVAFQTNNLKSIILPDSVEKIGVGAFATNPKVEAIILSKKLTEISDSAFGCSDMKNYMTNLTELQLHEGITRIGVRAFAGNNIKNIVIPSTVKEIGKYAFSTKNYLMDACELSLPEGLETIGEYAFRNKVIYSVVLPSTVSCLYDNTFLKEYSNDEEVVVTTVYLSKEQMENESCFPKSDYHKYELKADENDVEWTRYDFTYTEIDSENYSGVFISGLTESGQLKASLNPHLVIPQVDNNGETITGIASEAFAAIGNIESVMFPESISNFVILDDAFSNNKLSILDLTGVGYVGKNAFQNNRLINITFDNNIYKIDNNAFSNNEIQTIAFPEKTDNPLEIGQEAFSNNLIKAIQIPENTNSIEDNAFVSNTGMEAVSDDAPSELQSGGIVHLYVSADILSTMNSWVQKIVVGSLSESLTPWNISDFVIEGTVITGLTASGEEKRSLYPDMIMPDKTEDGQIITEIADAPASGYGLFAAEGELLNKVVLPEGLVKIGDNVFRSSGVTEIKFPDTLTAIGDSAFQMCQLESVILPDSVTTVGNGAFASNENLKTVKLSSQLKEIPNALFLNNNGNSNFTHIDIPEGVTTIGTRAFAGNAFTTLTLPSTVIEIGDYAFGQTDKISTLKEVNLNENLKSIGDDAFRNTQIETIDIPEGLISLGKEAFRLAKGINGVVQIYTKNEEHLNDDTENNYYAVGSYHMVLYSNLVGTGWTYADFTFSGQTLNGWSEKGQATRLQNKHLVLPCTNPETGEAITAIGDNAFAIPYSEIEQTKTGVYSPNGMISVDIPETVASIGNNAFIYNNLTTVNFPNQLTYIGETAFKGNKMIKVILPDTVTSVKEGAFATNDITEIKLSKAMTKIEAGTFSMNIHLDQIELHEGLTEIGDTAFAGARLTSLYIPSTVTKIGRKAFHLHHLSELHVPGNVKEVGESAFEGTPKGITLLSLTLGEGIQKIGERAFAYGYLKQVDLPESLEMLAADAFVENSGIENDHIVVCHVQKTEKAVELINSVELTGARFSLDLASPGEVEAVLCDKYNTVSLNWQGSEDATEYNIYCKIGSGDYSYLASTEELLCTLSGLEAGKKYTFKVVPAYYGIEGDYFSTASIYTLKKLNKPTITLSTSDKVKITWNNISGESGYQISVSESKAKTNIRETIKTKTGNTKVISVNKDKTYYYKVRAYVDTGVETIYGPWSDTVSFKLKTVSSVTGLKTTLYGYDDVKLSWKKTANANYYYVYYRKSTADKFTYLGRTTKTSYKKANLTDGVKYIFKVIPRYVSDKKIIGQGSSKTSTIYTLAKIKNIKVSKSSANKVKITWNNIYGESGYQISVSTSPKTNKIVKTYSTTSGKSAKISVEKGVKLYYKVRAYKTAGNKKIYGPWSDAIVFRLK